jgi:methylmalonyl-CoA mutase N-terminal domain/subunit
MKKETDIASEKELWARKYRIKETPLIQTDLGIEVQAVYAPSDIEDVDYLRDIGFPGQYPFTRGIYPEMYRHRMCQTLIITSIQGMDDTRARWKKLYEMGHKYISGVLDTPTHLGLDSDDPRSKHEVGRVGLAIDTMADFEELFEEVPMDKIPFACNEETLAAVLIAMFIAAADKHGIPRDKLAGAVSNDPLSSVVKGVTVLPIRQAVRLSCDLMEYCVENLPRFHPLQLKAVNLREGWADMAQEMGFSFANAICYIEELLKRGIDIDDFAPKLTLFSCCDTHIFEEVAKYRAARRIWARMMKERFGAKAPPSTMLRITSGTSPVVLQKEEPMLNLVRGTLGALITLLGGCQTVGSAAYDEVYDIPSEDAIHLALLTELVLLEETNVTKTVDPLGGSYYVEALTNETEKKILAKMQEVEDKGGAVKAVELGFIQEDVLKVFYDTHKAIDQGKLIYVGRNKYRSARAELEPTLYNPNPEFSKNQITKLWRIKRQRDNEKVTKCLRDVEIACREGVNLMPHLIEAAKAYASLGEVTSILKGMCGEYKEVLFI